MKGGSDIVSFLSQCALLHPINFFVKSEPHPVGKKTKGTSITRKNRYYSLKRMMMERFLGMNKSSSFKKPSLPIPECTQCGGGSE